MSNSVFSVSSYILVLRYKKTLSFFRKSYVWTQTLTTTRNPLWRLEGADRRNSTCGYPISKELYKAKKSSALDADVGQWKVLSEFCPGLSSTARFMMPEER